MDINGRDKNRVMQIDHLSFSSLNAFMKSPQDFVRYKTSKREPTPDMIIGSAFHCKVLQPDLFDEKFAVFSGDKRSNEAKLRFKQLQESGKEILSESDYDTVTWLLKTLHDNDCAMRLVNDITETEKKIEWVENGYNFVGYIDGLTPKYKIELKSCKDANPNDFHNEIYRRNYHVQQSMYSEVDDRQSIIIAVDKSGGVSCNLLSQEMINIGRDKYLKAVKDLKFCDAMDLWNQSYDFHSETGIHVVEKKSWMN